ncbi:MAG: hypothetical protein ACRC3Z_05795 [Phocaeicola sp.]
MKTIKLLGSLLLVFFVCTAFSMKGNKNKPVYVLGVSASFSDSLVFFTSIQKLDEVHLEHKMLPERAQYSYQLKSYLESSEGLANRTCFVYFSTNRRKLEKTIDKLESKYTKGGTSAVIRELSPDAFTFRKPETE